MSDYKKRDYNQIKKVDEVSVWKKLSKNGLEYFSGIIKIEGTEYLITFFNNKKTKETQPDFSFKKKEEKVGENQERKEDFQTDTIPF
jgi:hypothetical protein